MRRIQLAAVIGTAILFSPASALASSAHHKKTHHKKSAKKPAGVKNGTYKATFATLPGARTPGGEPFTIALSGAKVSLPASTSIPCNGPAPQETRLQGFVTPVALSASGSVTEHAPVTQETVPGAPPETGQSTFSVTFTKQGTASGYLEESLMGTLGTQPISCISGKLPFTAKLG